MGIKNQLNCNAISEKLQYIREGNLKEDLSITSGVNYDEGIQLIIVDITSKLSGIKK